MNRDAQNEQQLEMAARKTKRLLLLRSSSSVNGIRSLSRSLSIADDVGGKQVSEEEFVRALQDNNVSLAPHEITNIFTVLDRSGSHTIDPTEFIAAMYNDMNALRKVWLRRVWELFRKDPESGAVSVNELQKLFVAGGHPSVLRGETTAEAIQDEFESTFNNTTNPDGKVSRQEFLEYYAGVSASCNNDNSFVALLRGVWPLPGVSDAFTASLATGEARYQGTYHTEQTLEEKTAVARKEEMRAALLHIIKTQHTPAALSSGVAARGICLSLAEADTSRNGFVSEGSFLAALRQHRLYLRDTSLLRCLDTNGDGSVDVYYYVALLLPPFTPVRLMLLERLWARRFAKKDAMSCVPVQDFHRWYRAASAIDKDDFLTAWDVRRAIDGKVSLEELQQWYAPQSALVQRDKEFEALLHRQWGEYE
jgi:calcyphosin